MAKSPKPKKVKPKGIEVISSEAVVHYREFDTRQLPPLVLEEIKALWEKIRASMDIPEAIVGVDDWLELVMHGEGGALVLLARWEPDGGK